jgi:mono/diheme cytochrome c family protein
MKKPSFTMNRLWHREVLFLAAAIVLLIGTIIEAGRPGPAVASDPPGVAAPATKSAASPASLIERGKYLVTTMGCNDCHTPWKMGANGPEPDMTKMLSGHPQEVKITAGHVPPAGWMATTNNTFTAWSGPWGVSFTANLTPDAETGLGKWTEEEFVATMRSGRHMGRGRPILPPMPFPNVASLTDDDMDAVFQYLHSIPAIKNRVPEPIPPAGGGNPATGK